MVAIEVVVFFLECGTGRGEGGSGGEGVGKGSRDGVWM